MVTFTATYSPDDNKIRLTASARLDPDLYRRVDGAGFKWAPKLEQFIASMWTPEREDLALELAGEIMDEDSSLMGRAEDRAERFEGYQERRMEEAEQAREAVAAIADNIPLGQPILRGHHSERHARRDQERIERGMRKAVQLWRTSEYWKHRAAAAIRHAKYKERPDVRARRIKTLEADKRKRERQRKEAEVELRLWNMIEEEPTRFKRKEGPELTLLERARWVANRAHFPAVLHEDRGGYWSAWDVLRPTEEIFSDCPSLTPEEVLEKARGYYPERIAYCDRWLEHLNNRLEYERAMLADAGGITSDRVRPEKGGGCKCWASPRGGWSYIRKVNKVSVTVEDNWGNGGGNFTRTIPFDKLSAILSVAEVQEQRKAGNLHDSQDGTGFFLTGDFRPNPKPATEPDDSAAAFLALEKQAEAGVQIVTAPDLFPTPPPLAARMVELAEIEPEHRVLEPSAGTGNLLKAIGPSPDKVAVEINPGLVELLGRAGFSGLHIHQGDFLECNGEIGTFDRIVMNPPFSKGVDIKHIRHALDHLRPGGVLVALCANGSRQRDALQPLADLWEDLPPGSFKEAGTGVNVALLVIRR